MSQKASEPVLLTLVVPPDVAESLIDWMLARDSAGFSTMAGHGHGVSQAKLSIAEQVAGRQARHFIEIQLTLERAHLLLVDLGRDFEGAGFHYWIASLVEAGPLARSESDPI